MQFNYIYVGRMQTISKISLIRTLKDTEDMGLFEQEPIQVIIDYKWNTYTKNFFLVKLIIYFIYLSFFYFDMDYMHDENRKLGAYFYTIKGVCFVIQMWFLQYEVSQMINEKMEYLKDMWNYFELMGTFTYVTASSLEVHYEEITDASKMLYSISCLLALAKVLYLIRVFRQFSFLAMMII